MVGGMMELSGEIRVSGPVWLWSTQPLTLMKPGDPLPLRHDGMETGTGPATACPGRENGKPAAISGAGTTP